MKNKAVLLICLALLIAVLSGCGSAALSPSAESKTEETPGPVPPAAGQTVWQTQFVALDSESLRAKLQGLAVSGETLYSLSSGVIADETPEGLTPDWPEQYWVYGPILVKVKTDGTTALLPYPAARPENRAGIRSGVLLEQLSAASDGSLWVVENRYRIDESGSAGSEERTLVHLSAEGGELQRISLQSLAALDIHTLPGEGSYSFSVAGIADDAEGRLCLAINEWFSGDGRYRQSSRVCVLDPASGELKHVIDLESEAAALVRFGQGRIALADYQGATPVISLLDTETGRLSTVTALDDFLTDLVGGEDGSLYYGMGDGFYRLDVDTAESDKLFNWSACDVAHRDGDGVCVLPDGRLVTVLGHEESDGVHSELAVLRPVAAEAVPQRKSLRLAVMNLYPMTSEMISRFNRSQTEYRIEVTDYAQFNNYSSSDPADWNAGLTRLQTELISGNVPDLIDISLLPVGRLGEKGLLEDLLPYIDSDSELGRDQLNMHVLEAFSENGKLYQSVSNFYVLTTLGLSDVVGDRMGWTMEDLFSAMRPLQERDASSTVFDVYTTRDDALTFLLYLQMDDFVDWRTGTCRFDSPAFQELLRFVRGFPTSYDWGLGVTAAELDPDLRLAARQQLLKQCSLACFEDVQRNTVGLGGAGFTFVGYPIEQGVGSMFAQIGNAIAISSSCEDKAAAWAFVRQFFLPVYQEQFSGSVFPTNRSVYEDMKRAALSTSYQRSPDGSFTRNADGERITADHGSVLVAGTEIKLRAATREEVALVEEIIAATTHVLSTDASLKEILVSNAAPFFIDQRTVEETVRQIQSRASLYVSEQR